MRPKPLKLYEFTQIRKIKDDIWNFSPHSEISIDFFDNLYNNCYVGHILYRLNVGQIVQFYIDELYRNKGLGKQILEQTITEMKENNIEYIWCFTKYNHPFWSNIYNKKMIWCDNKNLHSSVNCNGYKMYI